MATTMRLIVVLSLVFLGSETLNAQTAAITQRSLVQAKMELGKLNADIEAAQGAIAYMEARLADRPPPIRLLHAGYNDLANMNYRDPAERTKVELRLVGLRSELRMLQDRAVIKNTRIATLEKTLSKQKSDPSTIRSGKDDDKEVIQNSDFSAGLKGWEIEGDEKTFRVFSLKSGEMAVTTYGDKKDGNTGRLFQSIDIPKDADKLEFYIHGGAGSKNDLYVGLRVNNTTYFQASARNDNKPFLVTWDVASLRGKSAILEIVDNSRAPFYGFIGAHGFRITND